jgi:hypothetical protein
MLSYHGFMDSILLCFALKTYCPVLYDSPTMFILEYAQIIVVSTGIIKEFFFSYGSQNGEEWCTSNAWGREVLRQVCAKV